jgi:hypothetical protein
MILSNMLTGMMSRPGGKMRRVFADLPNRPGFRVKRWQVGWVVWLCFFAGIGTQGLKAQESEWVTRYNGPADTVDRASSLVVDDSGNVYVTGSSWGVGTSIDYATIKYDADGETLWVSRYDGPVTGIDYPCGLALGLSGDVYVTGTSYGPGIDLDYATVKYDSGGGVLWVRRYQGLLEGNDVAASLALDDSGNVYVTGYSHAIGLNDYATLKYSSLGDSSWVRIYTGAGSYEDLPAAVAVDDSGNVYVTGASYDSVGTSDYATVKYNSLGDSVWVRRYNGPGNDNDIPSALAVDDSGNVYVTGASWGVGTLYDCATIKYSGSGDTVWVSRYVGGNADGASALALDDSGNAYVTGHSLGAGTGDDYITIKYNNVGDTLWARRYNGAVNSGDLARDITVDGSGNVCVTGYSWGAGTSTDYVTIKYSNTGEVLWVRRYDGPGNLGDEACALASDDSGNVYVTGWSTGVGAFDDYATVKYCRQLDIEALSITIPFDTVSPDSVYSPQAWVRNSSICAVTFDVISAIDGYADSQQVANLAPGESTLVTFAAWMVPPFDSTLYTMTTCIQILERDEDPTNDCVQKDIFAHGPLHDGGVVSLDSPGDTVFADSLYPVTATVQNFGGFPETFDVVATIDGYVDTVQVAGLVPDSFLQVNFTYWQVPSADSVAYTMMVCTYVVDDADSTNNCAQESVFACIPVGVLGQGIRRPQVLKFGLDENRPDPFYHSTVISYSLPAAAQVTLSVYDITGRLVETLVNDAQQPGIHQVHWDRKDNLSGVYFYRLNAGEFVETRKMVVID